MSWEATAAYAAFISYVQSATAPIVNALRLGLDALDFTFGASSETVREMSAAMRAKLDEFDAWVNDSVGRTVVEAMQGALRELFEEADFPLDPEDPFSAESLTFAVNHKLGTAIEDVTDPDSVKEYLLNRAAGEVNEALGEDVFEDGEALQDPEVWEEFIGGRAAESVNESIGVEAFSDFESLKDPAAWAVLVEAMIVDAANDASGFLGEHGCSAVNAVGDVICTTQKCHACVDDFEGCKERRKKDRERNEGRKCKRIK